MKNVIRHITLSILIVLSILGASVQASGTIISEIKVSPHGTYIAIGYTDGQITLLDYEHQNEIELRSNGENILGAVLFAWHPTEDILAVADIGGEIEVWDVDTLQLLISFPSMNYSPIVGLDWSNNGDRLFTGYYEGLIVIRELLGDIVTSFHTGSINNWVAKSPDDGSLIIGGDNGLSRWNIETGQPHFVLETGHIETNISFHPSGDKFFSWSINLSEQNNTLDIRDTDTGALIRTLTAPANVPIGGIWRSGWSPNGHLFYTASSLGYINVWDAYTGVFLRSIEYGNHIGGIDILPDESQFVFGGVPNDGQSATVQYAPVPIFPTADAGADQITTTTTVTLDGSASFDPDGEIVSYVWTLDGVEIATSAIAQVQLGVGVHVITLTVTDDDSATATDEVTITVR